MENRAAHPHQGVPPPPPGLGGLPIMHLAYSLPYFAQVHAHVFSLSLVSCDDCDMLEKLLMQNFETISSSNNSF